MALDIDDEGEMDRPDQSHSSRRRPAVFDAVRSSFPLQLAGMGLLFIAIGYVINTGVMAAVFPIWGVALLLIGLGSYTFINISQRGTRG